ncbi:HD-GYP domain-containing protein [Paenibacillus tengchongensis]|uniref:HD-GYP domain-containing protein n=1 Tax=Paenibacillus tengchongensis TaxID=2608684 RepID=UPI00124F2D73|nr:HD domain-containing phosphohydrolase [Paenibacillus tengchongensis]
MKVHVTDLKPGDCLLYDTFNANGLHVLPKGAAIRREDIASLLRHRIDYVDIELRSAGAVGAGRATDHGLHEEFDQILLGYESVFLEALAQGNFSKSVVEDTLRPFLEVLDRQKDVVSLLLLLDRDDLDIYEHSLQVGLLSYYLASWLGYSKEERYQISCAGLLHDIGKSQIPLSILNHPGPLTSLEAEELKLHTHFGYDMIRRSGLDETTALVALQHHEYADGSGYPGRLDRSRIHPFTEIVTVANVYFGLSTSSQGCSKQGLGTVLRRVHELGFGQLNGNVVQALTGHLLPGFVGKQVQLSNGETGTIVMINPLDLFKPLVKVNDRFRDLSRERSLFMDEVFVS